MRSKVSLALSLATTFSLLSAGAVGDDVDIMIEIRKCTILESPLSRLECFDKFADDNDGLSEPTISVGVGEWVVRESVNPINDTSTVTGILASENASNFLDERVTLILRCQSGRTEAYINWKYYLGSKAVVTDRIGKATAERLGWQVSTDSQSSFRPRARMFMESLADATTYIAQVTPYNESPIMASFNVEGSREVVERIRAACDW